mgnify:FL=1
MQRIYLCIDLKSFYASVECAERGLDPFKINLVVADPTRGGGAITLAATPAIKKLGVKSRGRIFEIPKNIEYIIAPPRMSLYMEYSALIYKIILKYISKEDIYVYSIDECFIDVTPYLNLYKLKVKDIAKLIINDIYKTTSITATCGIGTNMFLCKVALDICAKHKNDNIAYLDEDVFKQTLWHHQPLTDFWMVGPGTVKRLASIGVYDLYGVTQTPENILYKLFGINAKALIDHAYGKEDTCISDIKAYKPKANSISNSQILFEDYNYKDAYTVLKEMVEANVLELTSKHVVTNHISLYIGYSKDVIKASSGSNKISNTTNSYKILLNEFTLLYKRIININYPIRKIGISFGNLKDEYYAEYDLFTDIEEIEKEHKSQEAMVYIKQKYGKNAILTGTSYLDKATGRKRNKLIGGHNAKS